MNYNNILKNQTQTIFFLKNKLYSKKTCTTYDLPYETEINPYKINWIKLKKYTFVKKLM